MKKIICPTDFSTTANYAIEYAANLAKKLNAELEILNVQIVSQVAPLASAVIAKEEHIAINDKLQKICNEVKASFNITCNYSVELSTNTLETAIGEKTDKDNLIVIGTNGADDIYQYIFGTNSFNIIEKAKCPVLLLPHGTKYNGINKIVFSWDYSKDNRISFNQMKALLKGFTPKVEFLHLSKGKTPLSDAVFNMFKDDINTYLGGNEQIKYERLHIENEEDIPNTLDDYMNDANADLLAITHYERGFFGNLFHGKVERDLSEMANYPLLVLHV